MATEPVTELETITRQVTPVLGTDSSYDVQIATARKYPRVITDFMRQTTKLATLDEATAAACIYALPRGGKNIEGPAVRLAELVAHGWGNLRIQAAVLDSNETHVAARAEAWDLQSNTAIGFEVKRRITDAAGKRYNDDMVTVTGAGAASIAFRNVVFKVVPSVYWRPIYQACRQVIAGTAETFQVRRDALLKKFQVMGVTLDQVYDVMAVKGIADITIDDMVVLTGLYTSLKEGDTTIEETFGPVSSPLKKAERKSAKKPTTQTSALTTVGGEPVFPSEPLPESPQQYPVKATEKPRAPVVAKNIGTITAVEITGASRARVVLDTGFIAGAKSEEFINSALRLRDAKTRVEVITEPSKVDPVRFAPNVTELIPLEAVE